jgi:hypothetical protein
LVLLRLAGGRVHIAPPGDRGLAAEHLLVEADGLLCVAGEEQIGIKRDGHGANPFGPTPGTSRVVTRGVPVLSDQVYRTCCNERAVSLHRHRTLAVKAAPDTQNA